MALCRIILLIQRSKRIKKLRTLFSETTAVIKNLNKLLEIELAHVCKLDRSVYSNLLIKSKNSQKGAFSIANSYTAKVIIL